MEKICYICVHWETHDREWSKNNESTARCKKIEDHICHDCEEAWTNDFETLHDFGCRFWEEM